MVSIIGSWELASWYEQSPGGGREPLFGAHPRGRLTYTAEGVVHAFMAAESRPRPKSDDIADADQMRLFQTMIAYSGTYRVDGDRIWHFIDMSWNQLWTKSEFIRYFELFGNQLRILTVPASELAESTGNVYIAEWARRGAQSLTRFSAST